MKLNKKIVLPLIICSLLFLTCFVNAEENNNEIENKEVKTKKLLTISKTSKLSGYTIIDGELYLVIWKSDEGRFVYKYEKERLKYIKMSQDKVKGFLEKGIPRAYNLEEEKIGIKKDMFLKISQSTYALNFYDMFVIKNNKEKNITNNKYYAYLISSSIYVYADAANEKIYFYGFDKEEDNSWGMYIYDIKAESFELFKPSEGGQVKGYPVNIYYINPIRIPNTAYLMYIVDKAGKNGGTAIMTVATEVWIEEIPEWKEEMEARNKENTVEASDKKEEVKYIIDGPANLRDKAKGKKVIGELADKAEVKILNKKGDWYEVESGEIKGWTFKDNIKENGATDPK